MHGRRRWRNLRLAGLLVLMAIGVMAVIAWFTPLVDDMVHYRRLGPLDDGGAR